MEQVQKKRVLLAINDRTAEKQISDLLEATDYQVREPIIKVADSLFACLAGNSPDTLVLADTLFPSVETKEEDVIHVLEEIRQRFSDTHIVLITRDLPASDPLLVRAVQLGIYSIISKNKVKPEQITKLIVSPANFHAVSHIFFQKNAQEMAFQSTDTTKTDALQAIIDAKDAEIAALKETISKAESTTAAPQEVKMAESSPQENVEAVTEEDPFEAPMPKPEKTVSQVKSRHTTRLILTAGAQRGCGNSTSTFLLAHTLAAQGRTLIIECDMESSFLHGVFHFPRNYEGLSGAIKALQDNECGILMNFPVKCTQLTSHFGSVPDTMKQLYLLAIHSEKANPFHDCFECQLEKHFAALIRFYLSQGFYDNIIVDMPLDNAVLLAHALQTLPVTLCCVTLNCNRYSAGNAIMLRKNVEAYGDFALKEQMQYLTTNDKPLSAQERHGIEQMLRCSPTQICYLDHIEREHPFSVSDEYFHSILKKIEEESNE